MFDRLIDLITGLLEGLQPFVVIRDYQEGVLLRFGKYRRTLMPGFHWLIPFVDHVDEVVIVWTTVTLPVQSVTTADERPVVVKGMVKYRVSDSKVFTLEAYDAKDALSDIACGILFDTIHSRSYSDCQSVDLAEIATQELKKESKKWGITVKGLTLTDFGTVRSFRLFNEGQNIG